MAKQAKMQRPPNDAWYHKQMCGPLFVYFTVHDNTEYGEKPESDDAVQVDWYICPDDEDKSEERAFASSDGDIHGPKADLGKLIDRAMEATREAAINLANSLLAFAAE